METIIKKLLILIFFGVLIFQNIFSQNYEEQIKAFRQSYIFEASGNYTSAIDELQKIYLSNSYEINLRLGYICYLSGRYTESITYYSRAVDLMPYSIEARFGFALPAAAIGNYSQVLKQYEKILEISPNNSLANYRLGMIYYEKQDYGNAEKYFEKVVNLYPFDYDGLTMLAWTKLKLAKSRESKVLFSKAILNNPDGKSALEGFQLVK